VQPVRLRIVPAAREGAFRQVWAAFGTGAIAVEEGAVLNGLEPDDVVAKGRWLKVADRAPRR
jgi:hypothetical protein